jgi:hypothetical protein
MAVETTFQVFQQLLKESIDSDTGLSTTLKASLKNRVDSLSQTEDRVLGIDQVESTAGSVTSDIPNASIEVAIGSLGTNRVEFGLITFATPVRIQGSDGAAMGLLSGHSGESANAAVAAADVTAQYRLTATDTWKAWTRNTVIPTTKTVQFALDIADQVGAVSVPQMWFLAEQL